MTQHKPRILSVDERDGMTCVFISDEAGRIVIGKARTNPEDESTGLLKAAADALKQWKTTPDQALSEIVSGVYCGRSMLNRDGLKVGLIVTKGQEDCFVLDRGARSLNEPLVPGELIRGVFGRIDSFGREVLPLYQDDIIKAVDELLSEKVEAICICLLNSYINPDHERKAAVVARTMFDDRDMAIPLILSSQFYPLRNELARVNTTVIEAGAAEPARDRLNKLIKELKGLAANFDLTLMASHGGAVGYETRELARTLVSGPIGAAVGARYLGRAIGLGNIVCLDIDRASADMALIMDGKYRIKSYTELDRHQFCLPTVQVDSIAAGAGLQLSVNPNSKRIKLGEDSEADSPTINDCQVALGLIDPNNFPGGERKLDRDKAVEAIKTRLAEPLGIDVFDAAAGMVELYEEGLKTRLQSALLSKGHAIEDYALLCCGGGGPALVAGLARGLKFKEVLVPVWAAGFSAFGCACADLEYRREISTEMSIPAGLSDERKAESAALLKGKCKELKSRIEAVLSKSGRDANKVRYRRSFRVQYLGLPKDLEIILPRDKLESAADLDALLEAFEESYKKIYPLSIMAPERGFTIAQAIVTGAIDTVKPVLPDEADSGPKPTGEAFKGERQAYFCGEWLNTLIWQMEELKSGNVIEGPAIVESRLTTLVLPPGATARLDNRMIFHIIIEDAD